MPGLPGNPRLPAVALTLAAGLLLLGGCAATGPAFTAPAGTPSPSGYGMAGEHTPSRVVVEAGARSRTWWTAFGSPRLDEVIRLALESSPDLAEARATLDRHQAEAEAARALLKPQIGLNARVERQLFNSEAFGFSGFPSRTFNIFSLGGLVSYDPDLFGVGRSRAAEAEALAEAAGWEADAAALSLSANVALEAVRIAGLNAQIEAAEQVIDDDRKLVELARRAEALGGLSRSGRVEIEAQLASDEARMPDLSRQRDQARRRLALLAGKSPTEWAPPDFRLADLMLPGTIPVSLPSELLQGRPDIKAAEAGLQAARLAARAEQADSLPKLNLTGDYAQTSNQIEDLFRSGSRGWNLSSGLTAPIYDGGLARANRKAAEADLRGAEARYRRTVLEAFSQVGGLMASLQAGETEVGAFRRAVDAAQTDADITLAGVRLGGTPLLRAIDARRQLSLARRNLAEAEARRLSDMIGLFAAAGADWRAAGDD
jgi:NodT family efflux transporter outer membrane factor (OMF) lipoprotein